MEAGYGGKLDMAHHNVHGSPARELDVAQKLNTAFPGGLVRWLQPRAVVY